MPAPRHNVPSYTRHMASGHAVVPLHGRDRYLGPFGSPVSLERRARAIAEWQAGAGSVDRSNSKALSLSRNEVLLACAEYALGYCTRDGKPSKTFDLLRHAM